MVLPRRYHQNDGILGFGVELSALARVPRRRVCYPPSGLPAVGVPHQAVPLGCASVSNRMPTLQFLSLSMRCCIFLVAGPARPIEFSLGHTARRIC